jgi:ferredoxin
MQVTVDADRCRGHAVCTTFCPEMFILTDDGYTVVAVPEVPAEFEAAVRAAVGSCPEHAIRTTE